jgi:FtsZ-binding cell division protein ZapB
VKPSLRKENNKVKQQQNSWEHRICLKKERGGGEEERKDE